MMYYKTRLKVSHWLPTTGLNPLLISLFTPPIPGCNLYMSNTCAGGLCVRGVVEFKNGWKN